MFQLLRFSSTTWTDLDGWKMAGVIMGAVAGFIVTAALIYYFIHGRCKNSSKRQVQPAREPNPSQQQAARPQCQVQPAQEPNPSQQQQAAGSQRQLQPAQKVKPNQHVGLSQRLSRAQPAPEPNPAEPHELLLV